MIEVYTWTTPNGQKPLVALEELGVPYQTRWVDITKGEQNHPDFLAINPNNKIPALVDTDGPGGQRVAVFESGAVLIYLADKTRQLLAHDGPDRYVALEWVFFQAGGTGPMIGQLGHFTKHAPERVPYAIERYTKEVERLFRVLDGRLAGSQFLAGSQYTIADVMNITWVLAAPKFGVEYSGHRHLARWVEEVSARPAVQRALAMKPR